MVRKTIHNALSIEIIVGIFRRAAFGNAKPYYKRDDEDTKRLQEIIKQYEKDGITVIVESLTNDKEPGHIHQPVGEIEENLLYNMNLLYPRRAPFGPPLIRRRRFVSTTQEY